MKKIYVTKYCLTDGIRIYDWDEKISEIGYVYPEVENKYFFSFRFARDAFITREEAVQDCEKRRKKKIELLQKQIARIENLNFNKD